MPASRHTSQHLSPDIVPAVASFLRLTSARHIGNMRRNSDTNIAGLISTSQGGAGHVSCARLYNKGVIREKNSPLHSGALGYRGSDHLPADGCANPTGRNQLARIAANGRGDGFPYRTYRLGNPKPGAGHHVRGSAAIRLYKHP